VSAFGFAIMNIRRDSQCSAGTSVLSLSLYPPQHPNRYGDGLAGHAIQSYNLYKHTIFKVISIYVPKSAKSQQLEAIKLSLDIYVDSKRFQQVG